jgi:hypothetical protein
MRKKRKERREKRKDERIGKQEKEKKWEKIPNLDIFGKKNKRQFMMLVLKLFFVKEA